MRNRVLLSCFAALAFPALASAADIVIEMPGINFTQKKIVAKVGDTLKFKNSSGYNHNVYVPEEEIGANMGDMQPGSEWALPLYKPGKYELLCGYHKNMKMTLEVKK